MRNKTIAILLISFVLVLVFTGCTNIAATDEDVVKIRIAHDKSVTTPDHQAFLKFEEIIEEKSNGKYDVIIFPGSQMGSGVDTFEQTRRGDIEMSVSTTAVLTRNLPEVAVWDSYFMFDDAEHAHRVLDGPVGEKLLEPLERQNLVGLGYMEIGFRNFSNSKREITKAEDLKGLKIRGYNPTQIKAWESLGSVMTSVSWNELFTSLQQKLIDGQECATANFYSEKFYEAQKYWSLTGHVYTNLLWFANKDFMDSLPTEDREMIEEVAKEIIDLDRELIAKAEEEALEAIAKEGVQVNEVSLEEKKKMGEIMNAAIKEDIVSICGQDIYDMVMKEIQDQRQILSEEV